MTKKILEVKHLKASIENKEIIKDFNLTIFENEIHVIMGPNGSGKSTFSKLLVGHPSYSIGHGQIEFDNEKVRKEFLDTILPLVNPEIVRELLINDLKSASEYRAIKNLKNVDCSELNKLDVDIKSL